MKTIPFSRPSIGKEEEEAVLEVLRSGWLTTGKKTHAFEDEFKNYLGVKSALAVNSATSGLHLALEAVGVDRDDFVITTPYTFTATAEVIRYLGAHPLFVDIEKDSWNICPEKIEAALKKTDIPPKAILPVHMTGVSCDMDAIIDLANQYTLKIVEDGAHSFPGKDGTGAYIGTRGDIGVYSFYANKTITTGEGGMIVTDNEELSKRMHVMRLHGMDRSMWNRFTETRASWEYDIVEAGYKYNLPDMASAIGLVQLKKADDFMKKRETASRRYTAGLEDLDFLTLPADHVSGSWHLYIIMVNPGILTIDRNRFIEELNTRGIGTSVHYIPLHLMTYYKERYNLKPEDYPVSFDKYKRSISLPLYPDITNEEIDYIVDAVRDIGRKFRG